MIYGSTIEDKFKQHQDEIKSMILGVKCYDLLPHKLINGTSVWLQDY